VIGYPSGQDGAILPARDYPPCPANNKSSMDQACSVKMAGYWPPSFYREFMDRVGVEVHKIAIKRRTPISSHLDRTNLVNNPNIYEFVCSFFNLKCLPGWENASLKEDVHAR